MKATFTLLACLISASAWAGGANDNEPFCTRAMNNCIHRGLVETVTKGSFNYGVCGEVELKCSMATFNNFQTLMARVSKPHAQEILGLAGITCAAPRANRPQEIACKKPNFDVNKYNWNGPIERVGYAPVTLKGANSLAILAEAAAKEAALKEAAAKAAADAAARKAAEEAARIAAEKAARAAAAAKAAAEAAAKQAAEDAAKAVGKQVALPEQSHLCRIYSERTEAHVQQALSSNPGYFCNNSVAWPLIGWTDQLKMTCGSYYPAEMAVIHGIYNRSCPNGDWSKVSKGFQGMERSGEPPLSKACTCDAGFNPFQNGNGPACINISKQTQNCKEDRVAVMPPMRPTPPAGCSCPAGKTYFPFEGGGYCVDPNQTGGAGVELVSCSKPPTGCFAVINGQCVDHTSPPPMNCVKDGDVIDCKPVGYDPRHGLAVNITLKSRADCVTKVGAFSALYKTMVAAGSIGPISDAMSYCQKMFPEAKSPAMPVQFVGTPNFGSVDQCEQAMGLAQAHGATFQRSNQKGEVVVPFTDVKAYCAEEAPHREPIPGGGKVSFYMDRATMKSSDGKTPEMKWKNVTLVDGSTGQAMYSVHSFKVPENYKTLTVKMWGGGAANAMAGGDSVFKNLKAGGGLSAGYHIPSRGGQASGGDVNKNGNPGRTNGDGGDAPNGGSGAKLFGSGSVAGFPGGGGCGDPRNDLPGGGSGSYAEKVYQSGDLKAGEEILVEVGFGGLGVGAGGGGPGTPGPQPCTAGGAGRVDISWSVDGIKEMIIDDSGMTHNDNLADGNDPIVETNLPADENSCSIMGTTYSVGQVANCSNKPSSTKSCDVGPNMQSWVCTANGWKVKN